MLGNAPKQRGERREQTLPGRGLTFGPLDAGVLVVAEKEALPAVALVAAHHVDAALLTAPVALGTLVHICAGQRLVSGGWVRPPGGGRSLKRPAHTPPLLPSPTPGLRPGRSHRSALLHS